jgi:hypothetical protein
MTAHWIAEVEHTDTLRFRTALIAFHRIESRHDGESLAEVVLRLLDRAGITMKVQYCYYVDEVQVLMVFSRDWSFYVRQCKQQ